MNKKMLGDLMQQAQALQGRVAKMQEEAASQTVEASSGGGMVNVIVNGKQALLSIRIDPEVVRMDDVEMLQDLVMAAVNEGVRKSQEMMSQALKTVTGGISLPGMF
jgi:DNA-binding YbaB/EbfC family protein